MSSAMMMTMFGRAGCVVWANAGRAAASNAVTTHEDKTAARMGAEYTRTPTPLTPARSHMKMRIPMLVVLFGLASAFAYVHAAPDAPAAAAPPSPSPSPSLTLPGNAKPLVSGEFLSGTIWEKPILHAPPNSGYSPAA